jgi:3-oxoacyl-[acyl-carrier-protein] synthase II
MSALAILGWGAVSSAGVGAAAFAEAMHGPSSGTAADRTLVSFDVRAELGRKGTSFLDRRSALALVACREALQSAQVTIDDSNRHRTGIVLGTNWGSFKSMSDYTRETLVENPPYMVSAALFPNTVMNCAAGQAAIWFGLKGINATIAGGQAAFLNALRYAGNMLRWNRADTLLVGAVEEYTPHTASAARLMRPDSQLPAGEGAAVFVMRRASDAGGSDNASPSEVRSVVTGFCPRTGAAESIGRALQSCIRRALLEAGILPAQVSVAATGETGVSETDRIEADAVATVCGPDCRLLTVKAVVGECFAASAAFQLAAVLDAIPPSAGPERSFALVTSWTPEGSVSAAVARRLWRP